MPNKSVHPHRKMTSMLITGGDTGRWVDLDLQLTLPPEGGKFVGRLTAAGADLNKLGLINGANTDGKVYGFLPVSRNPNFIQHDIHERAANPSFVYPAGQSVYVINDLTGQFLIKVKGDIATAKSGLSYALVVENGVQLLDLATPGGPVIVTDEITESERGYVRVKLNSAAVA